MYVVKNLPQVCTSIENCSNLGELSYCYDFIKIQLHTVKIKKGTASEQCFCSHELWSPASVDVNNDSLAHVPSPRAPEMCILTNPQRTLTFPRA